MGCPLNLIIWCRKRKVIFPVGMNNQVTSAVVFELRRYFPCFCCYVVPAFVIKLERLHVFCSTVHTFILIIKKLLLNFLGYYSKVSLCIIKATNSFFIVQYLNDVYLKQLYIGKPKRNILYPQSAGQRLLNWVFYCLEVILKGPWENCRYFIQIT